MLTFVPVHFAVYRPLKPRLRWAMQCLVSYADHAGRCFPSLRTFAVQAGISKSAAGRDLAELAELGHVRRTRRPGGVYVYEIARRFLPDWPKKLLSQARDRKAKARQAMREDRALRAVPEPGTKENPDKKNQGYARPRVGFTGLDDGFPCPVDWAPRLRSWAKSQFWLPTWGPKPTEPGCWAPAELLTGS